jgi:hypothetical protein
LVVSSSSSRVSSSVLQFFALLYPQKEIFVPRILSTNPSSSFILKWRSSMQMWPIKEGGFPSDLREESNLSSIGHKDGAMDMWLLEAMVNLNPATEQHSVRLLISEVLFFISFCCSYSCWIHTATTWPVCILSIPCSVPLHPPPFLASISSGTS